MKKKKVYLLIFIFCFIFSYFPEYSIGYKENVNLNEAQLIIKKNGGIVTGTLDSNRMIYARINFISYFLLKMYSKKLDFIELEFRGERGVRMLDVIDTKNPTVNSN